MNRGMNEELQHLVTTQGGVISLRANPSLRHSIKRASGLRQLERLLPGIYGIPGASTSIAHRARAVALADPNAIITGEAAAALTWWPELRCGTLPVTRSGTHPPAAGYAWSRGRVPDELVVDAQGLRMSGVALSVLDMIPRIGGKAIDEALRRRVVSLTQLDEALRRTPNRRGNRDRAWLLRDSRDEPWSEPERLFHRHLRDAGVKGWETNYRVEIEPKAALLDVALPASLLAFEIDGRAYHSSAAAFERDRDRDGALAEAGWQVVRFSAAAVNDRDATIRRVLRIIAERRRVLRRGW